MAIFLILAPYGAYNFLMLVTSATSSVFAASAICLATVAIDVVRGRSVKTLAAGSAVVFAAIGLYLSLLDPALGTLGVKLSVDIGIFVISLGSMLLRRPFTLQYAVESVPAETAAMPGFLNANYVITGAWTTAALLMAAANLVLLYVPACRSGRALRSPSLLATARSTSQNGIPSIGRSSTVRPLAHCPTLAEQD